MYDQLARYYDLSHDRLTEDIPYLLQQAAETGGPVLEIGCGSGRLLLPLARAGYDVTGVDVSPEMLARAEARLAAEPADVRRRVRLLAGDARTLQLPGNETFGLIFFGYNTFMHLDEAAAGAALKRLRPMLRPGGRLLIDVAGPLMLSLAADDPGKVRNSTLVFDDTGHRVARYDKVHLFDVRVVGSAEQYAESATIAPGNRYMVAETPLGRLGLAVCYDLRFPEQFRALVEQGMEILALPAAFTAATGLAHWETLLRARAIENQCYVVASAQGGKHANGRETYGDSLIIDPWGIVLDRLPQGPGVVVAEFNRERLENVRQQFPVLQHRVRCES